MRKLIALFALTALAACHKEERVDVPDVTAQPTFVTQAMKRVQGNGFRAELRVQESSAIAPGFVIDQSPRTPQPRGATIALTVAARNMNAFDLQPADAENLSDPTAKQLESFFRRQIKVQVPQVSAPLTKAIRQLQAYGFRVAINATFNQFQPAGLSLAQDPVAGKEVPWGSTVTLFTTTTVSWNPALSEEDATQLSAATAQRIDNEIAAMPPIRIFFATPIRH